MKAVEWYGETTSREAFLASTSVRWLERGQEREEAMEPEAEVRFLWSSLEGSGRVVDRLSSLAA